MGTSLKGMILLLEGANSLLYEQFHGMKNQFHSIKWPPLNDTIFITHVLNLHNGCYAKDLCLNCLQKYPFMGVLFTSDPVIHVIRQRLKRPNNRTNLIALGGLTFLYCS